MKGATAAIGLAAAVLLGGCRSCTPARSTTDRGSGTFVREDAPDPFACLTNEDCVAGPAVDPDDGCCDTGVPLRVFARAYLEWRHRWVQEHCREVECPPLLPPTPPLPCSLEGRCVRGRCEGSCPGPQKGAAAQPGPAPASCGGSSGAREPEHVVLEPDLARSLELGEGWTPGPADVRRADEILCTCLRSLEEDHPDRATISEIASLLPEYRRQYVGYLGEDGGRALYVNLFRDPSGLRFGDGWRRGLVSARGGGRDFFSIRIDLDRGSCHGLSINSPR